MPIFRMSENMASFWIEKKSIKRICTCFSTMKGNEMERIAIYPGSFDPVTNGHLDIMKRASRMVDRLIIGVLNNNSKTPLFSVDERVNMLREVVKVLDNVVLTSFAGLQADFYKQQHADAVVRGIRDSRDYDYELFLARGIQMLIPEYEVVFLATDLRYSCVNSSTVRALGAYGGELSPFVPETVKLKVKEKFKEKYR